VNLPQQFGPYLLLERISVGGMAEVYKAKEYGVEDFERIVAVKRILPHVAEDEEFIAMFKDEAKIAVQLNHGNIAQIYNLGNEQDSFYIALEYINGRDLRAIFQKCQQAGRPMPVAQACYIIMKICEGLDYAHNKKDKYNRPLNIVHRDVSPPNILVSFEGEVKLIDFGVAKAAGRASRTQAGILKGKFGYMSPEQVRGMPLDRRSDVFSVGVVLFEILTSQRLFQADTDFATLEKVRAVEVPRPSSINPEIPKPLENIIYKALAREPEQRYQSSIELHDELQAFMFAQGMFYSRKDLAGWARENYAREIELEKEKANAQAGIRPNGAGQRRRTLMMPPGAGRPPPPPPGGVRRNTGAPPPPPRQAGTGRPPPPRGAAPGGPPRPPEPPAGARGRKNVKRKTMVMTTARPNLPKPAGGGGPPKPRPRVEAGSPRSAGLPKPTSSPPPKPRPKPVAKSTASYVATPGGQAPSADFDWDDDELETRLFEGKEEEKSQGGAKRTTAPISSRPGPAERGGARVVGGGIKTPELGSDEDSEAPTRVDLGGPPANLPPKSVTVSPSLSNPAPAIRQSSPTVPVSPARSAVPPVAHQAPLAPPQVAVPPAPMPSAAQGMAAAAAAGPAPGVGHPHAPPQHMPAPSASVSANANPFAPAPMAGYGGQPAPAGMPPHGMPMPAPVGMDFDDRPPKSNAGLVVVIVLALLILFGAGLGGFYLLLSDKDGGSSSSGNSDAVASQEQTDKGESAPATTASAKRGVLTIEVVPVSAQVTVDGASVDGPSPFVKPLTAGKHKIAVSHPDFLPFDKEVEVTDAGLTLPVRLHHRAVSLLVETDPAGGKVSLFVDGTEASTASSGGKISVTRDPTKKYEVQASLKGHVTQRNALDFTGDKTQPVKITLVKDAVAMAPPPATDPQPATNNGGGGGSTTKSNGGGGGSKVKRGGGGGGTKRKPKPAAKTATLKIGTNMGVAPASVYVDGKFVGKTPQGNVKVTPGRHTVKWQWDNGKKITQSVTVADGQTKLVKAG